MRPTWRAWARGWLLVLSLGLAATALADDPPVPAASFDLTRPEIAAFVRRLVDRDHLVEADVLAILGHAKPRPELIPAMTHPAEKVLEWWEYRAKFVTSGRIAAGAEYWRQHAAELDQAGVRFGVAPEYLVAILGVETNYGQAAGGYREVDTLMTLAFDYPARDAYFRSELRQFLLLCREIGFDPLAIKGSYGGALGAPQLMPSSYRQFAASAPARQHADLWTDWPLILASVAEFLTKRGWQPGERVLLDVHTAGNRDVGSSGGITLNETVGALRRRGVRIDKSVRAAEPAVLIRAVLKDSVAYRVGLTNFRVLSRYNPRINYTMAVCDLATEIRAAHETAPLPAAPSAPVSAPTTSAPAAPDRSPSPRPPGRAAAAGAGA